MRITTWHVLPCLKEKHFFNVNSSSVTRSVYADEHHIVMAQFGFQTRYLLLKLNANTNEYHVSCVKFLTTLVDLSTLLT